MRKFYLLSYNNKPFYDLHEYDFVPRNIQSLYYPYSENMPNVLRHDYYIFDKESSTRKKDVYLHKIAYSPLMTIGYIDEVEPNVMRDYISNDISIESTNTQLYNGKIDIVPGLSYSSCSEISAGVALYYIKCLNCFDENEVTEKFISLSDRKRNAIYRYRSLMEETIKNSITHYNKFYEEKQKSENAKKTQEEMQLKLINQFIDDTKKYK